jgi:hypothetical protein
MAVALASLFALGCGPASLVAPASAGPTWIGSRVGADTLANTPIGGPFGTTLAFRFRATWSGSITSLRFYVVVNGGGNLGYSGGDGGTLAVSVVAQGEDGLPAREALATATLHPRTDAISFPKVRFDSPPNIVAGSDYAIVFTNTSPQPAENYVSVNGLVAHAAGTAPPLSLADGVLLGDSEGGAAPSNWRTRGGAAFDKYLPIVEIAGASKEQRLGIGYMESWISNPKRIDRTDAVRELFTFTQAREARVQRALVRVRRIGDHVGPLSVRIETEQGHALAVANIPGAQAPLDGAGWVSAVFRKPPLVRNGQKVALVLRSAGGTFQAYPLRKGTAFGFGPATVFSSGYAQFLHGGSWKGWDQWGDADRRDGDLQFALQLSY